jgi:hypothetical protein
MHWIVMKVLLAILIFLLICVGANCKTTIDARINHKELEVYKTLLGDKPKEIVVIQSGSFLEVFGIDRDALKEILKELRNDTFDNFVKLNSVPPKIEDDVKANFNYPLVNGIDFNKDNLEHTRYYVFSRVGFSRDGKQAVVRFSHVCHPLCSKGAYYLLENKNGVWEIVQESVYVQS